MIGILWFVCGASAIGAVILTISIYQDYKVLKEDD